MSLANRIHTPAVRVDWAEKVVERMTTLWREQNSASIIAEKLSEEFKAPFTRNAVIGKIHRLNLVGQGAPKNTSPEYVRKTRSGKGTVKGPVNSFKSGKGGGNTILPPTPVVEQPGIAIPKSGRVSLDSLRFNSCRWPFGDPRDEENFSYCGDHAIPGKPYCPTHQQLAYRPIEKKAKPAWRAHR